MFYKQTTEKSIRCVRSIKKLNHSINTKVLLKKMPNIHATVQCEKCKKDFRSDKLKRHSEVCKGERKPEELDECLMCGKTMIKDNIQKHQQTKNCILPKSIRDKYPK